MDRPTLNTLKKQLANQEGDEIKIGRPLLVDLIESYERISEDQQSLAEGFNTLMGRGRK